MTARAFGIRFSACYALMMIGSGVQLPFLPLWLAAKGLAVSEIATVVAAMMAVRVIGAPFFAWLADYLGNRLLVIRACSVIALLAYLSLPFANGFGQILPVALAAGLFFAPVFPLTEGFSVDASVTHGLDYGRIRLWASLSFLTGSLISGALLIHLPHEQTVWLIAGAQCFNVIATFMLPSEPEKPHDHHANALDFVAALKFLFASRFTVFLFAASLANASHAMMYSFSSVHWTSLGFSTLTIGILWACAVLSEVGLFAFSNRIIERLGSPLLLCIGLGGGIIRWSGMAFVTNELAFAVLQSLHAISFAAAHLALMHFIRLNVPGNLRNTAQGLYAALAGGVLLSSVTWMSGPLYASYGGYAYLAMAGICSAGMFMALSYLRLSPKVPVVMAA
jgi:MFS transporter, PPP family, 3-phenylpropionic acid transporter